MAGTLYLLGTPIGNLGDISQRAVETLKNVDFIAAEDTRVTLKLLNHLDIKKPMISYFEHNKRSRGAEIVNRLQAGENCALTTDAGMPAISDPGEDLVALCAQQDIPVSVIPGPCAAVCGVALSGLPTGRFCFEGFLSVNKKSRREHLLSVANEERTLVFYEAPHKLRHTLKDLYDTLGDRQITLAREITKIHENIFRTTLSKAVDYYRSNQPKGEFVLIIKGREADKREEPVAENKESAADLARRYMSEGMSRTDAVKKAANETGVKRSELYKMTIE